MAKKKNLTDRQKRVRRRRRRNTLSRVMFALEIIVLVVLMGGLFVYAKLGKLNHETINEEELDVNESVTENQVMKGYTTIALVGIDSRDDKLKSDWNSDTMIIASINNDTKKVKLVSVYRDTYLCLGEDEDENNSYGLANSAYCTGGAKKMINMLNKNLDMNISDFVTVNFQAVAETVELLGGIDVEMKKEEVVHLNNYCVETSEVTGMDYTPLEEIEGVHHLNGVQAVAYARIRKTSGNDFRRAARQREVIYRIVEKAKNSSIATLNTVLDKIFPMIYTSLTEKEILSMGMDMLSYDIEDQTGFPFDHLYGDTVKEIEEITGNTYDTIYVVGGGSNAGYLNELTAKYTGKKVSAGPGEATAIGNVIVQLLHDGVFRDLAEARVCVRDSFDIKEYEF